VFDWVRDVPILSLVCYLPLVGALPIFFMRDARAIARYATAVAAADFLLSLPLWFAFERDGALFQFRESASWIDTIGVRYEFGVDGIALLLVLLTTLLGVFAFLSSWSAIHTREKEYYPSCCSSRPACWGSSWRWTSSSSMSSGRSCWCRCTS